MDRETLHEAKNEMKLCLLCKGEYSDTDARLHRMFALHRKEYITYAPAPNTPDGAYHRYISKLFNLGNSKRLIK